jgi:hypothetical protein
VRLTVVVALGLAVVVARLTVVAVRLTVVVAIGLAVVAARLTVVVTDLAVVDVEAPWELARETMATIKNIFTCSNQNICINIIFQST